MAIFTERMDASRGEEIDMTARQINWLRDEAKKADGSKNYVILENPAAAKQLDDLLVEEYWPVIQKSLMDSDYVYSPEKPETDFEIGVQLTRAMKFMLFDGTKAFFRGKLSMAPDGWMLHREFFLLLEKEHDPQLIFEILGNSRFRGMPPTLTIDKSVASFYQITLTSGDGAGWGRYDDEEIKKRITGVIEANIKMYDIVRNGRLSIDMLGTFLALAYTAYEAY